MTHPAELPPLPTGGAYSGLTAEAKCQTIATHNARLLAELLMSNAIDDPDGWAEVDMGDGASFTVLSPGGHTVTVEVAYP